MSEHVYTLDPFLRICDKQSLDTGKADKIRIRYAAPVSARNTLGVLSGTVRGMSRKSGKGSVAVPGSRTSGRDSGRPYLLSELIDKQIKSNMKRLESERQTLRKKDRLSPVAEVSVKQEVKPSAVEDTWYHPHKKEIKPAEEELAGKFQKNRLQHPPQSDAKVTDGLTEPMSKLAKDINSWFSEVMEHLAKAESAQASSGTNKQTELSGKKKEKRTKSPNVRNKNVVTANRNTSAVAQKRMSGDKQAAPAQKTNSKANDLGRLSTSKPPRDGAQNLEVQLSALNGELERHKLGNYKSEELGRDERSMRIPEIPADRGSARMLEIKPSLVENTENTDAPLASTASWWPYGASQDMLAEIPATHNKVFSKGSKVISEPSSAGSAKIDPASPKNQQMTKASSSEYARKGTKTLTASQKSSTQKQKGFILLNNNEKEKERQAWLKRSKEKEAFKSKKNKDFILVNEDKPVVSKDQPKPNASPTDRARNRADRLAVSRKSSLEKEKSFILLNNNKNERNRQMTLKNDKEEEAFVSSRNAGFILFDDDEFAAMPYVRRSSNNVLLTDNPHVAAAAAAAKRKNQNINKTRQGSTKNHTQMAATGQSEKDRKPVKKISPVSSRHKIGTGLANDIVRPPPAMPGTKRWEELVAQKLSEIQQAKLATSGVDLSSASASGIHIRGEKKLAQQVEASRELGSLAGIKASPDETGTGTVQSSTGKYDQGSGTTEDNFFDEQERDDADAEYKRRFGEFINESSDNREIPDESSFTSLFGPMTQKQHELLKSMRKDEKPMLRATNTGIANTDKSSHGQKPVKESLNYSQRNAQSLRPVAVDELKPIVKSKPKGHKVGEKQCKKSEPQLCVKPEEIVSVKKSAANVSEITTKKTNVSTRLSSGSTNRRADVPGKGGVQKQIPDKLPKFGLESKELWLSMLQSKMDKYRALVESDLESKEGAHSNSPKPMSNNQSQTLASLKPIKNQNQRDTGRKNVKSTKSSRNLEIDGHDTKPARPAKWNVESYEAKKLRAQIKESPKLSQERLKQSVEAKTSSDNHSDLGSSKQDPVRLVAEKPESNEKTSGTRGYVPSAKQLLTANNEKQVEKTLAKEKNLLVHKPDRSEWSKNNKTAKDLDPFEAWIESREDWRPVREGKPLKSTSKISTATPESMKAASGENGLSRKKESQDGPKKKYPRFEREPRPGIEQAVYRDLRTTYAKLQSESPPLDGRTTLAGIKQPLQNLSQSDQIYNMIKEKTQPRSGLESPNPMPPFGRRSKILTQVGLGSITGSKAGLVDPARLPKLGNLLSSIDGFIAMDAVPVLLEQGTKPKKSCAKSTKMDAYLAKSRERSQASGDGLNGTDVRASLAKEREAAHTAARRRLMKEYERNIEKYEKGLEIYRTKLRQMKQAMTDSKPRTDNPRRHSDF
ncbi:hypothetical protein PoB_004643800 [Plakobranchus ocellatus]|uniref:Uncharacterized protein n=1 Tax=Plakobranchus ocellatus TaxID=259542 RepID=A0AAV4BM98_9GAST|nr:hypothetical protein PoB_004643800 [Plakobranchus ocellatus]